MDDDYFSINRALSEMRNRVESDDYHLFSSGFPDLDQYIGGFGRGELIVLASRSGMDRTPVSVRMIDSVAIEQREAVLAFSTDKSIESYCHASIGSQLEYHFDFVRGRSHSDHFFDALDFLIEKYRGARLHVDTRPGLTVKKLKNHACEYAQDAGRLGMIVVSSVGDLNLRKYGTSECDQLLGVSAALKKLALRVQCPVLAITEISDEVIRGRKQMRPRLSDLQGNGALAKCADLLLLVHNEKVYDPRSEESREIIVAKSRNGSLCTARFEEKQIFNDDKLRKKIASKKGNSSPNCS